MYVCIHAHIPCTLLGPSGHFSLLHHFQFSLGRGTLCNQTQLVYPLDLPCKVESNLPSGGQMTTATSIFQHLNLLLNQSHTLKQQIQLCYDCFQNRGFSASVHEITDMEGVPLCHFSCQDISY
jgi:hypothetical protein